VAITGDDTSRLDAASIPQQNRPAERKQKANDLRMKSPRLSHGQTGTRAAWVRSIFVSRTARFIRQ
jgi:hypothetical protein